MKTFKGVFSFLLCVILVFSLAGNAFAGDYQNPYDHLDDYFDENGNIDYERFRNDERVYMLDQMGAPYPEGVNVMVGGEFVEFPYGKPTIVDGRTVVPFRALYEFVGATVSYDAAANKATVLFGDRTIEIAPGNTEINVTNPGGKEVIHCDVAPFNDSESGSMFVPVYFAAISIGYDVTWDSEMWIATIYNKAAVIEEIDADFTVINRLLAQINGDKNATYKVSHDAQLKVGSEVLAPNAEPEITEIKFNLTGTSIENKTASDSKFSYSSDISENLISTDLSKLTPEEIRLLAGLQHGTVETIENFETQKMYVRSSLLSVLTGDEIPTDAWAVIPGGMTPALLSFAGIGDIGGIGYSSIGEMLLATETDPDYAVYEAESLAAVFGDDAFRKTVSGGKTTYKISQTAFTADIASLFFGGYYSAPTYFTITLVEENGKFISADIATYDEYNGEESIVKISFDGTTFTVSLNQSTATEFSDGLKINDYTKISYSFSKAVTSESPRLAPPDGDSVIDLSAPVDDGAGDTEPGYNEPGAVDFFKAFGASSASESAFDFPSGSPLLSFGEILANAAKSLIR